MARLRESKEMALFAVSSVLLLAGGVAWLLAAGTPARVLLIAGTVLGLVFSVSWTAGAIRRHQPSVDVIAVLALAGALAVDEPFAGAVITVMLASGQFLEARASARARRELSLLAERAPRTARRRVEGGVAEVPVDDVVPGDRLLVGAGGIVPVDGRLLSPAVLDESALTGESRPAERIAGEDVRSGVVNAGQPIELVATAAAAESTYAGVVRLVEQAQASSAPFVRAADRFAVLFVPLTLALAAAAWALSQDPVRAVAVLVVATPCPLLLAAPIAIMSGLSRAARIGVVVKGGGALERLAAGRVMLFDKTGTLTQGRPGLAASSRRAAGWTRMSCCGSPPRSTRYRRMSWRAPSSPPPPAAGLRWRCRPRPGGARLRPGGDRRHSPGQARQGHVDRRRRAAAVGAPGAPAG